MGLCQTTPIKTKVLMKNGLVTAFSQTAPIPIFNTSKRNINLFTLKEDEEFIEILEKREYGEICKVFNKSENLYKAYKIFFYNPENSNEDQAYQIELEDLIYQEVEKLENPIFIKYDGLFRFSRKIVNHFNNDRNFVFTMESGIINLKEMLSMHGPYCYEEAIYIIAALAKGFELLEEINICHRSIQSENIMIVEDSTKQNEFLYKIFNFSESCKLNPNEREIDLVQKSELHNKLQELEENSNKYDPFLSDVYCFGLLICEISGYNSSQIESISLNIENSKKFNEDFHVLMQKILDKNPKNRISFKEIYENLSKQISKKPIYDKNEIMKWKVKIFDSPIKNLQNILEIFEIHEKLNNWETAGQFILKAKEIYDNNNELLANLEEEAKFYYCLGLSHEIKEKNDEAEAYYNKSFNLYQKEHKKLFVLKKLIFLNFKKEEYKEYLLNFEELAKIFYKNDDEELAKVFNFLGEMYSTKNNLQKAKNYHQKSLNLYKKLYPNGHERIANSLVCLGNIWEEEFLVGEAEKFYNKAINMYEQLYGEYNESISFILENLLIPLIKIDVKTCEEMFKKLIKIKVYLYGEFDESVLNVWKQLADFYVMLDKFKTQKNEKNVRLEDTYMKIIEMLEIKANNPKLIEDKGNNTMDLCNYILRLAHFFKESENYGKSDIYYNIYYKKYLEHFGEDKQIESCLKSLGYVNEKIGNLQKAEEHYINLYTIREKNLGKNNEITDEAAMLLFNIYQTLQNYEKAEEILVEHCKFIEEKYGASHENVMGTFNIRFKFYSHKKDYNNALINAEKVVKMCIDLFGDHEKTSIALINLGNVYEKLNKNDKAEESFLISLQMINHVYPEKIEKTEESIKKLRNFYKKIGNTEKTQEYSIKLMKICEKVYGNESPKFLEAKNFK